MKKKKRARQYLIEKFGRQAGELKTGGNELNPLAEFGNVKSIRASQSAQAAFYQSGDLEKFEYFFSHGGCFESEVQRQMVKDNNIEALKIFLKHWEFTPLLRVYMIKRAEPEFVIVYVAKKSLGRQYEDLVSCRRFDEKFWRKIYVYLPRRIQEKAVAAGRIRFE